MKKFSLLIIIMSILGGLGYGGYWYWFRNTPTGPIYQIAPITRGDITQLITANGQLNPVMTVQVGSQVSGNIRKLNADFNSIVKKGDIVAELDPATFETSVLRATGELANAKAALELARIQKDRTQNLVNKDAAPKSSLDQAVATFQQAEATVQIREASLNEAKVNLSRCTVYSPIDGIVISRNVDVGQTVAASLSAPTLFVIANDLTKMQIDTNVSEADIGNIKTEQEVIFSVDAYPSQKFKGKVRQVRNSPIVVQNVVSYNTIIDVDNSELKLKPGMTANVSIITAQKKNILQIKNAALRVKIDLGDSSKNPVKSDEKHGLTGDMPPKNREGRFGEGRGRAKKVEFTIYLLEDPSGVEKPKPVTIKTGISDGLLTEVVEGVEEGKNVIVAVNIDESKPNANAPGAGNPFSGAGGGGPPGTGGPGRIRRL